VAKRDYNHVNGFHDYKAIITAGGIGTRMLPFSKEIPKEMFPIVMFNGSHCLEMKPVVQAIFEQLHKIGVRDFYVVVGRGKRAIEDHFSPDPRFSAYLKERGKDPECLSEFYSKIKSSKIVFLNQTESLGFGDAVLLGEPFVRGTFIVQAGDTYILSEDNGYLKKLAAMHHKYNAAATILLQDVPDPRHYGVVEGSQLENGVIRITSAQEKPRTPKTNQAIMPIYVFTKEIFRALSRTDPGVGNEVQLTDAIQKLIAAGKTVIGVKLSDNELRLDLGSPETMVEALKLSLNYVEAKTRKEMESSPKDEIILAQTS
jgi:UTP--glucose-1-phosphate uridylyltransferase